MPPEPDPRDVRYFVYATKRRAGTPIHNIVEHIRERDPDIDSPQALYQSLHRDGYPVCPDCGEQPVQPGHCREEAPKRRPRKWGIPHDLPPASAATSLFQERLEALARAVENLPELVEVSQGGRFVGTSVYHDPILISRGDVSEEAWQGLCESEGKDPTLDRNLFSGLVMRSPVGSSHVPPRPLVLLIASYALADGDMGALLRALHPNPEEADTERLSRLLHANKREHGEDGLIRRAEQIAILVRGGKVGRGAPPSEITPREQNAACHITHRREQDWSEIRISDELALRGFTRDDVSRLGDLRLRWPD